VVRIPSSALGGNRGSIPLWGDFFFETGTIARIYKIKKKITKE